MTQAQSAAVRAIGPTTSNDGNPGNTPARLSSPWLGFSVVTPQHAAGLIRLPAVSVPSATGIIPAATAAALPPLDPPAMRRAFHGLAVCGVLPPLRKRSACVCPISTAPAARHFFHKEQSSPAT